jgi:hypothetical protein
MIESRRMRKRVAFVFCAVSIVVACDALIGADFDRSARDDGGASSGEAGAMGDASGVVGPDGAALGDGSGGGKVDGSGMGGADGSSGGGGDGSASGRTPVQIFGVTLKIWLDAAKSVFTTGGNPVVVAWNDQSGNGANGTPYGSGGGQLTLVTNAVNGLPAIEVDGDGLNIGNKSPAIAMTDDFYFALVAQYTLFGSNDRFFFARYNTSGHGYGFFAGTQNSAATAASLDNSLSPVLSSLTSTADGKYRVYALRRTAGSGGMAKLDVRVNGASTASEVPYASTQTDDVRPLVFGANELPASQLVSFMMGAIAEIVVVQGTAQDADIVELETNLMSKYALK